MIRFIGIICLIALSFGAITIHADDINTRLKENRQELDSFKGRLEATKQKIDSLKAVEGKLQKTISKYSDNVNRNRTIVEKLTRDLKSVRNTLSDYQQNLITAEDKLVQFRNRYRDILVESYLHRQKTPFEEWDYETVLSKVRMNRYLKAVSNLSAQRIVQTDDSIRLLSQTVDSLAQAGSKISRLKKKKQAKIAIDLTLKEKEEKTLGNVQNKASYLRDRLVSLSEMARQMESIIAELEKSQKQRRARKQINERFLSGAFLGLKGKLSVPIRGRVVSSFGWKVNKTTKLKSFSPGIDIKARRGEKQVRACAAGRVVYVGNLRGYNSFVIVEHDDDYYTTYAGMTAVNVSINELVTAGTKLGTIGGGAVHFEIRKGREHLDPVIWLDIDGF